jgi:cellulose biosynthesis protein BcsQ
MMVDEDRLEGLYAAESPTSILRAVQPLIDREGDIADAPIIEVNEISLIPGDLALHEFDDRLADSWARCLEDKQSELRDAVKVQTALHRIIDNAGQRAAADIALLDVGPSLGPLNRSVLLSADGVVVPMAADLFSLRGLANVGRTLKDWRAAWNERLKKALTTSIRPLPQGEMKVAGYVALHHAVRDNRPVRAYQRWINRIPVEYHKHILNESWPANIPADRDPHLLATTRNYLTLMALAQDARKPVFALKPADGAIGTQMSRVLDARKDFEGLARRIADKVGIPLAR